METRRIGRARQRCLAVALTTFFAVLPIAAPVAAPLVQRLNLLFMAVAIGGLVFCSFAGLRCTIHTLREEIQNGTSAQLLQTDLRVPGFVFGLFTARLFHGFHEILPVFPLLFLPAAMGASPLMEFWRVVLVWVSVLFASIAAATLSAVWSRDERRALIAFLVFVLGQAVWLPLLGAWTKFAPGASQFFPWLTGFSSSTALRLAFEAEFAGDPGGFFRAVVSQFALGTACLVMACAKWRSSLRLMATPAARAIRSRVAGLVILPAFASVALLVSARAGDRAACLGAFAMHFAAHVTIKSILALQAACVLPDARRVGFLQLELGSLLSVEEILARYLSEVFRPFRWPIFGLVLANLSVLGSICLSRRAPFVLEEKTLIAAVALAGAVQLVTDAYALRWTGLSHGLASAQAGAAAMRSWMSILVLPWVVVGIIALPNFGRFYTLNDFAAYFVCWFVLGVSLSWIRGGAAKRRVFQGLREF